MEDGISDIDCEALNDIYYLWKNATNPEVKEAFDLMIKGGTPSQKDFGYEVPKYNTGIEILFWLAERNEFKQDDTLALAIAVVNGLYFIMGDKQVRNTLNSRVNERLVLGREIDEWQNVAFLNYSLEKSSLLGKLYWAWDGNENGVFGTNRLVDYFLSGKKIDISTYEKVAISSRELRIMKNFMSQKELIMTNASDTITKLEEYL